MGGKSFIVDVEMSDRILDSTGERMIPERIKTGSIQTYLRGYVWGYSTPRELSN